MNLTFEMRQLLDPELSMKPNGVTTQMKAFDEYILMVGLCYYWRKLIFFCFSCFSYLFQLTVMYSCAEDRRVSLGTGNIK